jgi:membrane-bound lytic murein transglycosylase B
VRINVVLLLLLLTGCASQTQQAEPPKTAKPQVKQQPVLIKKPVTQAPSLPMPTGRYYAQQVTGDYARYPELAKFIDSIHQKYGISPEYLKGLFSQAKRKNWTLDYLRKSDADAGLTPGSTSPLPVKPSKGSWTRYRSKFLGERHINGGVAFARKYHNTLQKATQTYGVPSEYIIGILGVETSYGGFVGNHRIIDALTTLAFDYPRRADYFRGELENFLVMTARERIDPSKPVGSFAGAMGLGQFMPSSFLNWAVDFNGDGKKDLWNPEDAIGSVANYFAKHGWQPGKPVVTRAKLKTNQPLNIEFGLKTRYLLPELNKAGVYPAEPCACNDTLNLLLLRHETHDEYRLGHPNFYVITRYNQSTHYAMAIHELAQTIKRAI